MIQNQIFLYFHLKSFQALRQFRRMCNPPYDPAAAAASKVNSASKFSEAATYTSPFGEENSDIRPQTRAKSRLNHRTPYVQSAPQLLPHVKRPRSRRKPQEDQDVETGSTTSSTFKMFLSLPNTPDTEDPATIYQKNIQRSRQFPGFISSESYI